MRDGKKSGTFWHTYRYYILEAVLCICLGFLYQYIISGDTANTFHMNRANSAEYKFTNPLLSCNISENKEFSEYKPLESIIDTLNTQGVVASVYYRDLNSGRWFETNDQELYSPASLLKVPILVAYLKLADEEPEILSQSVLFSEDFATSNPFSNGIENYKSPHHIVPGSSYTILDLLNYMIKYSDNNATTLLFARIDENSLNEVMSDLRIQIPKSPIASGQTEFTNVKDYSYVFRLLYNSTYLSHKMSEKALSILGSTDFDQGIVAGLPKGTQVAHKFGERSDIDPHVGVTKRELHDCGIVYYPEHPYLLCVMTKGTDFNALSSSISSISRSVYQYIGKEYKK